MADEQVQQQFAMQRIYTKDISFESPATPDVFRKQWQPAVNVDLNTKSDKVDDNGNFDEFELRGVEVKPPKRQLLQ